MMADGQNNNAARIYLSIYLSRTAPRALLLLSLHILAGHRWNESSTPSRSNLIWNRAKDLLKYFQHEIRARPTANDSVAAIAAVSMPTRLWPGCAFKDSILSTAEFT